MNLEYPNLAVKLFTEIPLPLHLRSSEECEEISGNLIKNATRKLINIERERMIMNLSVANGEFIMRVEANR
jgi:hypothetical protein